MTCDIKSLPLRKQIVAYSSLSYGICLLLAMVIFISIFVGTNSTIRNSANDALFDQVQRGASKVMDGNSLWFTEKLNIGRESFTNVYLNAMGDTYRPDYSQDVLPSFFEYGDTYLSPPLTQDSRQTKPVSFENSAYYLPGSTPADIPNFSAITNSTRDQASHLDTFFRELYINNPDFVAGYIGFSADGQFRQYPGAGTLDTDPGRTYDPRIRGWYTDSTSNPNDFVYTSPYRDFNGKGWMITLAGVVRNIVSNAIVGVAGSDMLISAVQQTIQSVKFLDTGKISLFEDSGTVVADKEWAADPNDTVGFSYTDLQSPVVTAGMWSQIISASPGQTVNVGNDGYVVTATRLNGFGNKYLLVSFVPKAEILQPMTAIVDSMDNLNLIVSLSLLGAFIAAGIILVIFIVCTANQITKPFQEMNNDIDMMMQNIGDRQIGEGLERVGGGIGHEQQQLGGHFNEMIDAVRQAHEQASDNSQPNPFLGGQGPFIQDYSSQLSMQAFPPNAPPSAPSLQDLQTAGFDVVVEK